METALIEILKLTIPASLVLYAVYLTVKSFLNQQFRQQLGQQQEEGYKVILPMKLQAYERMTIFLERIAPQNLLVRLQGHELTAQEFQHILIHEIQQEYNHNISQQVYMSHEAWNLIKQAKEELISIISQTAQGFEEDAPAVQLSKRLFDHVLAQDHDFVQIALHFLKEEVQGLYSLK